MQIKNRITELRIVKASDLLPNPRNWRGHPEAQANALRAVLADVGFADAAIGRDTPEGVMLIDGHLRTEVASDSDIPVLIVDLSKEEADKVLATHDPLASMAEIDSAALSELTFDLDVPDVVGDLLNAVINNYETLSMEMDASDFTEGFAEDESDALESKFEIIVTCTGEAQQRTLLERFAIEGLECRSSIS